MIYFQGPRLPTLIVLLHSKPVLDDLFTIFIPFFFPSLSLFFPLLLYTKAGGNSEDHTADQNRSDVDQNRSDVDQKRSEDAPSLNDHQSDLNKSTNNTRLKSENRNKSEVTKVSLVINRMDTG